MAPPVVAKPDFSEPPRSSFADRIRAFLDLAGAPGSAPRNLEAAGELGLEELSDEVVSGEDDPVELLSGPPRLSGPQGGRAAQIPSALLLARPPDTQPAEPLVVDITGEDQSGRDGPSVAPAAFASPCLPLGLDSVPPAGRAEEAGETGLPAEMRGGGRWEAGGGAIASSESSSEETSSSGSTASTELEDGSTSDSADDDPPSPSGSEESTPQTKRGVEPQGDVVMTIYGGILEIKSP